MRDRYDDVLEALDLIEERLAADQQEGLLSAEEIDTLQRWFRRTRRDLTAKVEEEGDNARRRRR